MSFPPPYNHQEGNWFCQCQMCLSHTDLNLAQAQIPGDGPQPMTRETFGNLWDQSNDRLAACAWLDYMDRLKVIEREFYGPETVAPQHRVFLPTDFTMISMNPREILTNARRAEMFDDIKTEDGG